MEEALIAVGIFILMVIGSAAIALGVFVSIVLAVLGGFRK